MVESSVLERHYLLNLDEIGKKTFEEETPLATQGAPTFQRDPTSSIQSAEGGGLLLARSLGTDLSAVPAPWCYFPKDQPEVLTELKMRTVLENRFDFLLQREPQGGQAKTENLEPRV